MNSHSNTDNAAPDANVAVIYWQRGPALRVPLRGAREGGRPEEQLMQWFRRQLARHPVPPQIRGIVLRTEEPLCPACQHALRQFLGRYGLAAQLRLQALRPVPAGCRCQHGGQTTGAAGKPSFEVSVLDELLNETPVPRRAAPPRRPQPPLQLGTYNTVAGHHVHQSAAYTPPVPAGQSRPASAQANPNHGPAVTVRQNVPGFTATQHAQASRVQRAANQAAHGADVHKQAGPVRVHSSGIGRLPPTPTPGFEDLKAYYALLAAGRPPAEAYIAVQQSGRQLAAAGAVPRRVPRF